jgi:hypothetical protein
MNHHIAVTDPYVDVINHDVVVMIHHIDVNVDRIDVMLLQNFSSKV